MTQQPDNIRETLIKELGLATLEPEKQDEIVIALGEQIMQRAIMSVLDTLPEDKRTKFITISESGSAEDMQKLLTDNVPNLEEIVQREIKNRIETFKKAQETQS